MLKKAQLLGKTEVIHFIGIGGCSMSGIAEILLNLGFKVSGSDIMSSETTTHLKKIGVKVFIGHKASNVQNVDVVVYSSIIDTKNPEMKRAEALNIPIIPRAEMLAELMRLKRGIAIAGTHGKTTASSIISNIFFKANLKPTTLIGGKVYNIGSNVKLGKGEFLICEADESDASFLKLSPEVVVVTNIDNDHLDFYTNMQHLRNAFIEFINKITFYGFAVLCSDDKSVRSILPSLKKNIITYGLSRDADFTISNVKLKDRNTVFDLAYRKRKFKNIKLNTIGLHNVLNSTAAIIVGLKLGLKMDIINNGLKSFSGVESRLEYAGNVNNITIIGDYGHHPTEIKTTLEAVSCVKKYKKLIVIFQPHRYTRTKILHKNFKNSFDKADYIIIMDIYAAGERKIKGVTAKLIVDAVKKKKGKLFYIHNKKAVIRKIKEIAQPGDMILTLGAGDIKFLGKELLKEL